MLQGSSEHLKQLLGVSKNLPNHENNIRIIFFKKNKYKPAETERLLILKIDNNKESTFRNNAIDAHHLTQ